MPDDQIVEILDPESDHPSFKMDALESPPYWRLIASAGAYQVWHMRSYLAWTGVHQPRRFVPTSYMLVRNPWPSERRALPDRLHPLPVRVLAEIQPGRLWRREKARLLEDLARRAAQEAQEGALQ